MQPTAGTASGVHPVPLRFGRVSVQLDGPLDHKRWLAGLKQGRSFVTTGPMLLAQCKGQPVGSMPRGSVGPHGDITGEVHSSRSLKRIELVDNGRVLRLTEPANQPRLPAGYVNRLETEVTIEGSSWLAVRAFEPREGGRLPFAHAAPFHIEMADRPVRPRREEVEYLVQPVQRELERNQDILAEDALDEYRQALTGYEKRLEAVE